MQFSQFLKEIRVAAGYTQKDIADILKVDRSTYAYYESGKTEPNIQKLRQLANLYAMPLDDLLECRIRHGRLQFSTNDDAFTNDFESLHTLANLSQPERRLVLMYRAVNDKSRFMAYLNEYNDMTGQDADQ